MNMNEEVICGYLVTAEKKKANAVFLEMLTAFDRYCAEHELTWWLQFGGLIGAIRHKGFIPWDDDIDVMMPREDFDRLAALAASGNQPEAPYFIQTPESDPGFFQTLIRFRRGDTTYITAGERSRLEAGQDVPYNLGFTLSVFPLDNLPASAAARKLLRARAYFYHGLVSRTVSNTAPSSLFSRLCRFYVRTVGPARIIRRLNSCYRCKSAKSGIVHSFSGLYPATPTDWPAELYAETIRIPFEDITVPAPAGYDRILRITYGDYMTPVPPEQRGEGAHGDLVDAEVPYTVYRDRLLGASGKNHTTD